MLSVITAIIVYVIRQNLLKEPIKWQYMVYIAILVLYTKPILEQCINKLAYSYMTS